jgi:hypothetical protein
MKLKSMECVATADGVEPSPPALCHQRLPPASSALMVAVVDGLILSM